MATGRVLVFLDASVLVAAVGSRAGGSSLVMEVCGGSRFRAVVSERVMMEARKNVAEKFGEEGLLRFYKLLADLNPLMAPAASAEQTEECAGIVSAKDAHVLAASLGSGAGHLITLDRRHFLNERVRRADLRVKIMTPGDFLKSLIKTD